ncbi:MAG: DUF362 domain-containing protein [Candidatus Anammoxibacter sp.]
MNRVRRQFIKNMVSGAAGLSALSLLPSQCSSGSFMTNLFADQNGNDRSKVVLARAESLIKNSDNLNSRFISSILDDALMKITSAKSSEDAWRTLFNPKDIVGIKINALAGKSFSPHVELVESIVNGVKKAGVKEENIIIFDRLNKELVRAGYSIKSDRNGLKCFGTDALSGNGYGSQPEIIGSIGSCFSKIVSDYVTALINVPVLKDHDLSGVSVGMKNFYGIIHNPNKYHDNNCDPYIADLNSHPFIRGKLRLVICDAIKAQYNGGPAFKPQWIWNYGGLIVSSDPVSIDQIGYEIIDAKRKEMRIPLLKQVNREPLYIQTAASIGLGIADRKNINLIET